MIRRILVPCVAVGLLGCDEILHHFALDGGVVDECMGDAGPSRVGGTWEIRGAGEVEGCADPDVDGKFDVASERLDVRQDGADLSLESAPRGFTLRPYDDQTPFVRGRCVKFRTEEQTADGPLILRFDGFVGDTGNITGTFSGDGPSTCSADGEFAIDVR